MHWLVGIGMGTIFEPGAVFFCAFTAGSIDQPYYFSYFKWLAGEVWVAFF